MPPLLSEEESALDPYTLLNISSTATEKDVRKAYRQKSLKYHPDRNDTPEGAIMFRQISLAQEILVDTAKRAWVDTKLEGERVRKAKYAEMDNRKRAMVDALNQREEAAKKHKVDQVKRSQEAIAEEAIKEEGRRMREEATKRASGNGFQSPRPTPQAMNGHTKPKSTATNHDPQPPISAADLTLILNIPSTSFIASSSTSLQSTLSNRYGSINHVLLTDPPIDVAGTKKKKKGRKAVVEFHEGNWGGCWACWKDHSDVDGGVVSDSEGIKAKWGNGSKPEWVEWAARKSRLLSNGHAPQEDQHKHHRSNGNGVTYGREEEGVGGFASAPDFGGTTMADLLHRHQEGKEKKKKEDEFESMTLLRMRQMERERLAEEIRRQEDAEEEIVA